MMRSKKKKVIIITQNIEPYRCKFYEQLSKKLNGNLLGIHSNIIDCKMNFEAVKVKKLSVFKLQFQLGLIKAIYQNNPYLIIAEFDLHVISNLILLLLSKILGIKFIWWGIGLGSNKSLYILRKFLIQMANGVIVYEDSSKSKLIQIGVNPNKVGVMKNTIYTPNPEFNKCLLDKKNLFVVGKLDKRKGIDELIISFSEVFHSLRNIDKIVIIGEGPEKDNLIKLCNDLNVFNSIVFKGKILDETILKKEFHKALATIHPFQAGLSVLHSFSYGVPFVTSVGAISGGESENIIADFNGVLYDGTRNNLNNIILDIDNNPKKFHQFGNNAFNYYINGRTIYHMVDNYYNSINNLIYGE